MKFVRKCNKCGCGMNEGFVFGDGCEYYCSTGCVYLDKLFRGNGYTKKHLDLDYENDNVYWTEWEELDSDGYYTEDGKWIDTEKETKIFMGQLPEICGDGISVFDTTQNGVRKKLKESFYNMRNAYLKYNRGWNGSYDTFEQAMGYFGGRIIEIDMNETYDDNIRN
tara:strand:- start:186 stop:683 length:498 start_codon:yes stop_codon:yes gene_type:complete